MDGYNNTVKYAKRKDERKSENKEGFQRRSAFYAMIDKQGHDSGTFLLASLHLPKYHSLSVPTFPDVETVVILVVPLLLFCRKRTRFAIGL